MVRRPNELFKRNVKMYIDMDCRPKHLNRGAEMNQRQIPDTQALRLKEVNKMLIMVDDDYMMLIQKYGELQKEFEDYKAKNPAKPVAEVPDALSQSST